MLADAVDVEEVCPPVLGPCVARMAVRKVTSTLHSSMEVRARWLSSSRVAVDTVVVPMGRESGLGWTTRDSKDRMSISLGFLATRTPLTIADWLLFRVFAAKASLPSVRRAARALCIID